jgi:hypothetical protein
VPFRCDCAHATHYNGNWQHCQEAKPYQRFCYQAALLEIVISRRDKLVEAWDLLVQMRAYTTDEQVSVGRHLA